MYVKSAIILGGFSLCYLALVFWATSLPSIRAGLAAHYRWLRQLGRGR